MIVVYGVKRKIKIVKSLGQNTCTNCGHVVETALAKEGGYCHVYYIPVFPYVGGLKFIACPNCGVMEPVSSQKFKEIKNQQ